jgi:hypothetical protein
MPLRTSAEIASLQRIAEGGVEDPWRFVNGIVPSSGVQARGTNGRSERIQRLNDQIREREQAERREKAEWDAGKPERDRLEALRTPAARIGEMNELLTEAKSLFDVLREKSTEVRRLSDNLSQVKAEQVLAETSDDDPMERAKTIVFAKEAIPLIQKSLDEARAEVVPIEEAILENSKQLDGLGTDLLRKLREERRQQLVLELERAICKVLPLDRKTLEGLVEKSQLFADYTVRIPAYAEPGEWSQCIEELFALSTEPKKRSKP